MFNSAFGQPLSRMHPAPSLSMQLASRHPRCTIISLQPRIPSHLIALTNG